MSQDYNHYQNIFTFSNGLQQQQHIAQQIRRDKLRAQGETHPPPPPFSGIIEQDETMMSEMFSFPQYGAVSTNTELLEAQMSQGYRSPRAAPPPPSDWFFHQQGPAAASAMQLFPSSSSAPAGGQFGQFTWLLPNENSSNPSSSNNNNNNNEILGSVVEGQQQQQRGLSLSLSSSLQQMGGGGGGAYSRQWSSVLRASKYAKAAQELLEEFCSVGGGQFRKVKTNNKPGGGGGGDGESAAASSKDHHRPNLSASDRLEHQRRKVKLLSMLDEVERRYNHYCEQMQMVVNSYDVIMGQGAARPYTSLAHKAMSRHFRCLKEALAAQLKQSCEVLGEKDPAPWKSGATKGETPRLRMLEQSLRQQRAYQQMDQQEAWRPQRGLPDTSVNALRAWLFEHFLNPYPSDADKQILARQTGLSRNQVSNWFINARVRLWKPMVEEMYQQEANEERDRDHTTSSSSTTASASTSPAASTAQIPTPPPTTTPATTSFTPPPAQVAINAHENDPSFPSINAHFFSENHPMTDPADAASSFPAGMWRRHPTTQFRTNGGDVSLTLGLRHDAGSFPEENPFSVRDFDGC